MDTWHTGKRSRPPKELALAIAAGLVVGLTACSPAEPPTTTTQPSQVEPAGPNGPAFPTCATKTPQPTVQLSKGASITVSNGNPEEVCVLIKGSDVEADSNVALMTDPPAAVKLVVFGVDSTEKGPRSVSFDLKLPRLSNTDATFQDINKLTVLFQRHDNTEVSGAIFEVSDGKLLPGRALSIAEITKIVTEDIHDLLVVPLSHGQSVEPKPAPLTR